MITCYFGVPGCGKTSILAQIGIKELNKIKKDKSQYLHVYTNFYLKGAEKISFSDMKDFRPEESLILLDELAIDADNRNFKNFDAATRDFFILHRHANNDIVYTTQNYTMVDMKIKNLTYDLWYMYRPPTFLLGQFTFAKRIFRTVAINEHTSDLVLGYRFSNFLERISNKCVRIVPRFLYYKFFSTNQLMQIKDRPVFKSEGVWE